MRRVSALLILVVAVALAAVPGHAQSVSVCQFTTHVSLSPGTTPTPAQGTFTTGGQTGTVTCQGAINATGTVGYSGTFGTGATAAIGGDNCAIGSGGGTYTYVLGATTLTGGFSFVRAAVAGAFVADNHTLGGTFQFQPDSGQDCATVPVTGATVTGQALLLY